MSVDQNSSRPTKRRKVDPEGVIVGAGGFLTEPLNQSEEQVQEDVIPFELIPTALQALDLPPDDDEILSVFKNASSGWSSAHDSPLTSAAESKYVSRADWRSVCAVLLENRSVPGESKPHRWAEDDEGSDTYVDQSEIGSEEDASSNSSKDEYMEEPASRRPKVRKPLSGKASTTRLLSHQSDTLSGRQAQVCVNAFALFFPDVTPENLEDQRIMIKDLQRVAKLLNEKLKADEMVDMLDLFSTSLDKSVSFSDFCRMMVAARLA
ncbi:hypothetical protein CPB83DRAFT_778522 [Crepidotus variabilis]|uniref:EF-hand domain-containing protein n=1 Tax=Crepidotus variabilis TaxID=179855 RepID=A0A9P6E2Z6_9AGAR|nr:hypothetical protein CPB83DRAFT_778522 [Crepidotus variabilis]